MNGYLMRHRSTLVYVRLWIILCVYLSYVWFCGLTRKIMIAQQIWTFVEFFFAFFRLRFSQLISTLLFSYFLYEICVKWKKCVFFTGIPFQYNFFFVFEIWSEMWLRGGAYLKSFAVTIFFKQKSFSRIFASIGIISL